MAKVPQITHFVIFFCFRSLPKRVDERYYDCFHHHMLLAVLNDQTMRRIARKAGSKRSDLGYELDLESTDIDQILCKYSDPTDQAFRILLVSRQ